MLEYTIYQQEKDFDLVLGQGVQFEGKISSPTVLLDGAEIEGQLVSDGMCVLKSKACFRGDLIAKLSYIDAHYHGKIQAEKAYFFKHAQLKGSVECRALGVEEGSVMTGNLMVKR